MSTRSNLDLRLEDVARWDALFRVLAVARWWPFLVEMGLPTAMATQPDALGACAQTYVLERGLIGPQGADRGVAYLSRLLDMLHTTLSCVADAYGADVADAFVVWSRRTVVDEDSARRLVVWGALLPWLCDEPVEGEATTCQSLASDLVTRLCGEITPYLSAETMREIHTWLTVARGEQPTSAYEDQLNAEIAYAAGNGQHVMDALDLAAELIESVIRAERTWRAWTVMAERLEDSDRVRLLDWGRCRAEAAGMTAPEGLPNA